MFPNEEILRGRKQIAQFLGISLQTVDELIDRGTLPICRISQKESGVVYSTKKLLVEYIEELSHVQRSSRLKKKS